MLIAGAQRVLQGGRQDKERLALDKYAKGLSSMNEGYSVPQSNHNGDLSQRNIPGGIGARRLVE